MQYNAVECPANVTAHYYSVCQMTEDILFQQYIVSTLNDIFVYFSAILINTLIFTFMQLPYNICK